MELSADNDIIIGPPQPELNKTIGMISVSYSSTRTAVHRSSSSYRYDAGLVVDDGNAGGFLVLLDASTPSPSLFSVSSTVDSSREFSFFRYDVIGRPSFSDDRNYTADEGDDCSLLVECGAENGVTMVAVTGSGMNWPALLLFAIVVATIGGNVLVCLAVSYMRKLQNMFNYFLVSLALSDMMSAILVMPLSIVRSAVGEYVNMQ